MLRSKPVRRAGLLTLLVLAACGRTGAPAAGPGAPAPLLVPGPAGASGVAGLHRTDPGFATFTTPAYTVIQLGRNERPSIRLPVAGCELPLINGVGLIAWGAGWKRLAQEDLLDGRKIASEESGGGLVTRLSGTGGQMTVEVTRTYHPGALSFAGRVKVSADLAECRRLAFELNPDWTAVAGARLSAVMADGSTRELTIPSTPTVKDAYVPLLSGDITSLRVEDMHGLPGAGFTITGPLSCALEQTGILMRWHLGIPGLPRALRAGEELTFAFTITPEQPASPPARRCQAATVEIDAAASGPIVPEALFGANLAKIGHGVAGKGMRHPWQKNPARDPESARYMRESGVSFFRVYVQHLFDTLGQCGGDTAQDPIAPAAGAPCDYTRADPFIEGLRTAGIGLMPCVGLYCPPWLSSRRPSPNHSGLWIIHRAPPTDNAAWAAIIAGLVRHWNIEKGYGIHLWQVGNEPDDWSRFWVGGTLPEFADYFTTAAAAMKAVDPGIRISGPDLAGIHSTAWPERKEEWREGFSRRCQGRFDDFSWNCYVRDDFTAQVRDVRATLLATGNETASISISEYNRTPGDYDNPDVFTFDGAFYLCRAMASLMANRVDRAAFFCWDDDSSLGLFGQGADGTLVPRPMYHAFRLHAGLGRLKGGHLLPVEGLPDGVLATAVRHADDAGVSLILAANQPLAGGFDLDLRLSGLSGLSLSEGWSLAPGRELEPLPADGRAADSGLAVRLPSRAIALLVLRRP